MNGLDEYIAGIVAASRRIDPRWHAVGLNMVTLSDGGVAYTFTLVYSGRAVASVDNRGDGGGPLVRFSAPEMRAAWLDEADRLFPGEMLAEESLVEALLTKEGK